MLVTMTSGGQQDSHADQMVFQQMKSHATDRLMAERPSTGGHVTPLLTTSIKLNPGACSFISGLQHRWVILMNHAQY
jgi:hypothetical protein